MSPSFFFFLFNYLLPIEGQNRVCPPDWPLFYEPGFSQQYHLSHRKAPSDLCSLKRSRDLPRRSLQLAKHPAEEQADTWAECSPHLLVSQWCWSRTFCTRVQGHRRLVLGSISGSLFSVTKAMRCCAGTGEHGCGAKWSWSADSRAFVYICA